MCESEDADELKSFEARLANLVPREDRLDRERLMFLIGQASERAAGEPSPSPSLKGRGNVRAWQAAFGAMSAVAATLMCMLIMRPADRGLARSGDATSRGVEQALQQPRTNVVGDHGEEVLAVRDVYSGDIERRMARLSAAGGAAAPVNETKQPALTPASWRQVFSPSTSSEASGAGSSAMPNSWRTHA